MKDLKEKYQKEVIPAMREKFSYKNLMAVPKIEKIVVSAGIGKAIVQKTSDEQKKAIEAVVLGISSLAGQRPSVSKAKKSVASFKLRQGMTVGARVNLRGKRMYDFLSRLINIAIPRLRDFRGIDVKSFDRQGNLNLGFREHSVFPEISPEEIRFPFGVEVTVVTTSKSKEEGVELLRLIGFPIKKLD